MIVYEDRKERGKTSIIINPVIHNTIAHHPAMDAAQFLSSSPWQLSPLFIYGWIQEAI